MGKTPYLGLMEALSGNGLLSDLLHTTLNGPWPLTEQLNMTDELVGSSTRSGATETSGRKSSSLGRHEPPGCEGLPTYPVSHLKWTAQWYLVSQHNLITTVKFLNIWTLKILL